MIGLAYTLAIALLFFGLLAWESEDGATRLRRSGEGLLGWLGADNWPAKVGGALVVIGVGALLRYVLLHVAVPPDYKLAGGVLASAFLALLAWRLEGNAARRGLQLALAGAAAGVAYLTAYSAFAFFGYIDDVAGATLLILVAAAVWWFAVQAEAVSLAMLGMLGAYAAPAFALGDPGPLVVYGYYGALSVLVLAMVMARGWRPLIHLSFLFTLAGGLFFGWAAQYYRPVYYGVMQPTLLAMVALHLAMPLVERYHGRHIAGAPTPWFERLDHGYFIALPTVALLLTYCIAPRTSPEAALGTLGLAALWAVAALCVFGDRREAGRHAVVALLLATASALAWFDDLPMTLLGMFVMAAVLTLAVRLELSAALEGFVAFILTLLAALYVLQSMFERGHGMVLVNGWFGERLLAAGLMSWCAWLRRERAPGFAQFMHLMAALLLCASVVVELLRAHIDLTAEFVNLVAIAALAFAAWRADRWSAAGTCARLALLLAWFSAAWAADQARLATTLALAVLDVAALAFAAQRFAGHSRRDDSTAILALLALPLVLGHWCSGLAPLVDDRAVFLLLTVVTLALLAVAVYGAMVAWLETRWTQLVLPALFWLAAYGLAAVTTCYIARGGWPVAYELSAALLLASLARLLREQRGADGRLLAVMIALALVLQAMLLRGFAPVEDAVMTVLDLPRMRLPAVVSLTWAILGAALAAWGGRRAQRGTWSAGSGLMAVAAAKLVLFDFGALGELGNILALLAAGGVFLLVAWAVPMPPRAAPPAPRAAPDPSAAPKVPSAEFGMFNLRPREDGAAPPTQDV